VPSGLIVVECKFDLAGIQRIAELVAVIVFVADQDVGIRHLRINQLCSNRLR